LAKDREMKDALTVGHEIIHRDIGLNESVSLMKLLIEPLYKAKHLNFAKEHIGKSEYFWKKVSNRELGSDGKTIRHTCGRNLVKPVVTRSICPLPSVHGRGVVVV
jgi:hypothetical protein